MTVFGAYLSEIYGIDNEKIKYRVEMRKNGEQFKKVYEGKDLKYRFTNLDMNKKYELKICSIYNDYIGPWSNILNTKQKFMIMIFITIL